MSREMPSVDVLRAALTYDPETGFLVWNTRSDVPPKWNGRYAGTIAGTSSKGRCVTLIIDGRHLKAHRAIWKMVHGRDPVEIDHIDGDPQNNRMANLREATRSQNARNVRGRNAAGYKGVSIHRDSGLWRARIRVEGKEICEYHQTPTKAHAAYCRLARQHYGEFART
jgi:hypothetical protein